jgi:hypothetical protein
MIVREADTIYRTFVATVEGEMRRPTWGRGGNFRHR